MILLPEINSTNLFIRALSFECDLPSGFAVRAEFQSAGHGQASNKWESERKKNMLCSVLLKPETIDLESQFVLSQLVSIAIVDVLREYINKPIKIKWPNDIYVDDKKICGILIENSILGSTWSHSIVGIGLNINQEIFTSDAPNPISIKQITATDNDVDDISNKIVSNIIAYLGVYNTEKNDDLRELYFKYLYRNSGEYEYLDCNSGEVFTAMIREIKPTGHIILKAKPSIRSLNLSNNKSEEDEYEYRIYAFKEIKFL